MAPVMGGFMRKRVTILSSTIATAAMLALGLQAAPAVAVSTDACSLTSKAKLESILGLGHVEWRDQPAHLYPEESDGMSHTTCNGTAYSGSTPFTLAEKKRKVTEGKAAQFGWEIYGPDLGAPAEDLERWTTPKEGHESGYEELTTGITHEPVAILAGLQYAAKHKGGVFSVPALGAETHIGVQAEVGGVLPGVRAAGGVWTTASDFALFEVAVEQGTHAHALKKKLVKLANLLEPVSGI
jgi:hypothetical protein